MLYYKIKLQKNALFFTKIHFYFIAISWGLQMYANYIEEKGGISKTKLEMQSRAVA